MSVNRLRRAEDEFFRLKGQLAAGRITPEQFDSALKNLMVQDAQGRYWMLGPDSGKWYVHDGQNWVEAQPASLPSPSAHMRGDTVEKSVPPRKSNPALWVSCCGCALLILIGLLILLGALSQGLVRISIGATATPTMTSTPIPPSPTITPLPTNTPSPTNTLLPTIQIPSPISKPAPTVTPTRLTTPIFGTVVCSSLFDEKSNTPINPSPNKIVEAGGNRIYASWSYQVPDPFTFKYTWYYEGNEFFADQGTLTETTGTMWVGAWYNDLRKLTTGSWKFEIRTLDNKILLTDTCTIR